MDKEQLFEKMVRENKDTIYMVCYMFSKDRDEVADLFQEALANLWKGMPQLSSDNVRGWIYRVTLNTCISLDRKKRSRSRAELSMNIDLFNADSDARVKQVDMLHQRINCLQPFDRAIVLLWLEDISYEEIGQILGISTKNVSVRLFRIREQLKKMSND